MNLMPISGAPSSRGARINAADLITAARAANLPAQAEGDTAGAAKVALLEDKARCAEPQSPIVFFRLLVKVFSRARRTDR